MQLRIDSVNNEPYLYAALCRAPKRRDHICSTAVGAEVKG